MLIDTHVHIGQFYDKYYSVDDLLAFIEDCEIVRCVVSSTTTCENDYQKVISEIQELCNKSCSKIIPCLWLTEHFIQDSILEILLSSGIHWQCLKIHPALNRNEWAIGSRSMDKLIGIAMNFSLPILIHTGDDKWCESSHYENYFKKYPDVDFILAHGRPIKQAIKMLDKYNNVYVDTAFMPIEHILKIVKHQQLQEKVLWGSDVFLPSIYLPEKDMALLYKEKLECLRMHTSEDILEMITFKNALSLFDIPKKGL